MKGVRERGDSGGKGGKEGVLGRAVRMGEGLDLVRDFRLGCSVGERYARLLRRRGSCRAPGVGLMKWCGGTQTGSLTMRLGFLGAGAIFLLLFSCTGVGAGTGCFVKWSAGTRTGSFTMRLHRPFVLRLGLRVVSVFEC